MVIFTSPVKWQAEQHMNEHAAVMIRDIVRRVSTIPTRTDAASYILSNLIQSRARSHPTYM
jgi:hypothetical protein